MRRVFFAPTRVASVFFAAKQEMEVHTWILTYDNIHENFIKRSGHESYKTQPEKALKPISAPMA